jgi:DNA-binding GntR family transcriptional regulator
MSQSSIKEPPARGELGDVRRQTNSGLGSERYTGPLYSQVAEILRQKIFSLEWEPSKAIPNEQMLAVKMSVSVGTVRKALALLECERLVRRTRGKGTFVIDACDDGELDRFCHLYVGSRPLRPYQSSISNSAGTATHEEAQKLGLEMGCPVYRIKRLLIEPKCALVHEEIVVSALLFPDLPSLIDGSYRFLFPLYARHFDIFVNQTIECARPIRLNPEIASALRLHADPVGLSIDRVAMATGVGPVEWTSQSINLLDAVFKMTSA